MRHYSCQLNKNLNIVLLTSEDRPRAADRIPCSASALPHLGRLWKGWPYWPRFDPFYGRENHNIALFTSADLSEAADHIRVGQNHVFFLQIKTENHGLKKITFEDQRRAADHIPCSAWAPPRPDTWWKGWRWAGGGVLGLPRGSVTTSAPIPRPRGAPWTFWGWLEMDCINFLGL